MKNIENEFKNRVNGMNLVKQKMDHEKICKLMTEYRESPTKEKAQRIKRRFWDEIKMYHVNYKTKFDYFNKPE